MKNLYLFAALFLASCNANPEAAIRQNLAGQPMEYQDGYIDGCWSGKAAAGHPHYRFTKLVQRFANDKIYAQGWDDGFSVCKGGYEANTRLIK